MLKSIACAFLLVFPVTTAGAQPSAKRPITFEDFAAVRIVSDPQLSPDGTMVLYAVRTADLTANTRTTVTYIAPVAGGAVRRFPNPSMNAAEARWSPDGTLITYTSAGQLWIADASGAHIRQLTTLTGGASGPIWAATGRLIAFTSSVTPSCRDDACNAAWDKMRNTSTVKARVYDQLLFRHWTTYDDSTRTHLFVIAPTGAELRDVTPGVLYDIPPRPFGGSEGYTFSPDGQELAYTAKDQGRADAWSTDLNVYTVPVVGGTPTVITASNKGADANPVYSPDGSVILYNSQERAGFESDQLRLMAYDRVAHASTRLAAAWDRNADSYAFSPDGKTIYLQTIDHGREKFFTLARTGNAWATLPTLAVGDRNNASATIAATGKTMAWVRDAVDHPPEVYVATVDTNGVVTNAYQLTHENDVLVSQLKLSPVEDYWFTGALGDSIQGFVLKPPQYAPGTRFPVLFLIHGGPQSAFLDNWHQRWNVSLFASPGYAVVYLNPHGSLGYGQKFTDEVSGDWGGAAYKDLMMGLDTALVRNVAWMDTAYVGAAGASYGGYMVNWIAGHTTRFKALFTHDGVFNLENMYGATEEIWFTDWDLGGAYWNKKAMDTQYRVWSPHLYAGNFRTPHLVVQGELDYRVPTTEGISLFTALQRQGVPSRLILFPDEGHWVSKPLNQRLWYSEIFQWFGKYLLVD